MIVGLVTLITALFLGGPAQIFYVDNLEKGIKKYVVEKDRKKEILVEIKNTKKLNKEFEKERKQDYKTFLALYTDMNSTTEELNSFFKELQEKRSSYQNKLVDQRLLIFGRIEPEEWDNILESSLSVAEKNLAKAEKKALKSKEAFEKTRSKIQGLIIDSLEKQKLLEGIEHIAISEKELEDKLLSANSLQNTILANKNSGREALQEIVSADSKLRAGVLKSLVSFHELARENCTDVEWSQIIKTFKKDLQVSSR